MDMNTSSHSIIASRSALDAPDDVVASIENDEPLFKGKGPLFMMNRLRRPAGFDMIGRHYHNFYEILYYTDGELTMFLKDRSYSIAAGDIVLINALDMHTSIYPSDKSVERIMIRFNRAFLRSIFDDPLDSAVILRSFQAGSNVVHLTGSTRAEVERVVARMLEEQQAADREAILLSRLFLSEILVMISRVDKASRKDGDTKGSQGRSIASEAATYITQHFRDEITLSSLADTLCVSRFYLARVFKQHTGFTIVQYINNARITAAARMLKPGVRVAEVAMHVGFNNVSHFGKVFRRSMGMPPQRYRVERA
jgi:AraC-like DNA-binding protein